MHVLIGSGGVTDVDRALRREVDMLAGRLPQVDRAVIDRGVRGIYTELAATATIRSHLVARTKVVSVRPVRASRSCGSVVTMTAPMSKP